MLPYKTLFIIQKSEDEHGLQRNMGSQGRLT